MKNFTSAFSYVVKNFVVIALLCIFPAIFLSTFTNSKGITNFIINYKNSTIINLKSIYNLLFNFNFHNILFFILGSILLLIFVSVYFGHLENHFRSGKISYNFGGFINNNLLIVTTYYIYLIVSYLVYKFLLSVILFTTHIIFSGLNNAPNLFTTILAIIITLLTFLLLIFLFNYYLLALPTTIFNGYNVKTSLSDANELLSKKHLKTTLGLLVILIVAFSVGLLGSLFSFWWIAKIVSYFIVIMFVPLYSFICYYDYSNLQRYDIKNRFYY